MKIIKVTTVVFVLLLIFNFPAVAQIGPPPSGGGTSGPIDGGAVALLMGVAAYGYKALKSNKKSSD